MNLLLLINSDSNKDYSNFLNAIEDLQYNFLGFLALDGKKLFENIYGYTIYPLDYVNVLKFDLILAEWDPDNTKNLLVTLANYNFPVQKVRSVYWLLQQIMLKKYEDFEEPTIQETLKYWKTSNDLTVFNQHIENYPHTYSEILMDSTCDLPYIMFETIEGKKRRMYLPKTSAGMGVNDSTPPLQIYMKDILREQLPTSPHLYIKDEHKINEGDILIDAGVCEGNFALRYVDICSKVYLFEMDTKWMKPLYFSFRDCWDKVELIHKAVSDTTKGMNVALDDAVNCAKDSKIFVKMDIEGAEPAALRGAKNLLTNNKVKASVCSYHNSDDAWKIKSLFQKYNFKTWTSNGYMVFIWDKNIWNTADFRKGIVYAENY